MLFVVRAWYQRAWWLYLLVPLSWAFRLIARCRRLFWYYFAAQASAKVIVVGNITVGGSGKTPLVTWLAKHLAQQSLKVGIVTRGYRSNCPGYPYLVEAEDAAAVIGDESVMLRQVGVPIVIDPKRARGVRHLAHHCGCDVVISDDGLQHYAMRRDVEIAVVDAARGFGNGQCLPAGPLREPVKRLKSVDLVVSNGKTQRAEWHELETVPHALVNLASCDQTKPLDWLRDKTVHAVAGIGNPQRFFDMLAELGVHVIPHAFPDHHVYRAAELQFGDEYSIIMTEKDAVKCRAFNNKALWYIPITIIPDSAFVQALDAALTR